MALKLITPKKEIKISVIKIDKDRIAELTDVKELNNIEKLKLDIKL